MIDYLILGSSSFVSRYARKGSLSRSSTSAGIGQRSLLHHVFMTSDPLCYPLSGFYLRLFTYPL
jgi:hypothetical protein